MFNPKSYLEVNREERFYCALFAHTLLCSQETRRNFCGFIKHKFGMILEPTNFDVYLEAAALRDYWNDLGNPVVYDKDTHFRRREVLALVLREVNVSDTAIDRHDFFWTSRQHEKLWSPGRWNPRAIKEANLDESVKSRLLSVKWAFNAKPDILIISSSNSLIIEAKLESGEGLDGVTGYRQLEIQDLISRLLRCLAPQFNNSSFKNTTLEIEAKSGISWKEVLGLIRKAEIDDFTRRCFSEIASRYYRTAEWGV